MNDVLLKAQKVSKSFQTSNILKGIDFSLHEKEAVSIIGSSGAGKSTLLHILGGLDTATSGQVFYRDQELTGMSDEQRALFRQKELGFIFQFHYLMMELSVLDNVALPLKIQGWEAKKAMLEAEKWIERVGLSFQKKQFPSELSGGEMQRVSIARCMVKKPQIIMADEPTGNLDSHNSENIQQLLFELFRESESSLLVVTHDLKLASRFHRCLKMQDGEWV